MDAKTPAEGLRKGLMPLPEALALLLQRVPRPSATQTLPTLACDGRVLAQDVVALLDVPGHDNSAMDGYAVRVADVAAAVAQGRSLPVTQRVAAGTWPQPVPPGEVARVFTGAPLPEGADAVVMQEDVTVSPQEAGPPQATFTQVPPVGQWVRRRGEDVHHGQVVLTAGTRLGPAELGLAASLGFAALPVSARPRVALLSTGDELVMPGDLPPSQLPPGAIYNSNRFFLHALLQRLGCEVTDLGIVPDNLPATLAVLQQAAHTHDLVLSSGGVSVGEEDHIKPAVQQLGGLDLWQLAIKPGKPFAYGWLQTGTPSPARPCYFMGLPGNPVASFVTFLLLVRPFVLALQGVQGAALDLPVALPMPAHFTVAKADKRREFLRVRRNAAGGLDLFANQGSGVLTSMVWADGWVDKPAGSTIAHGDTVAYWPLHAFLN